MFIRELKTLSRLPAQMLIIADFNLIYRN
jgi:hypothetical protein